MKTRTLWAIIVLSAGALELYGLIRQRRGDTLSEYTWSKTSHPAVRTAVGAVTGWLPYHFTFGNGVPLSRWDLVFAGTGAVLGLVSWYMGRGRS
jgi:hypothetical protein